MLVFKNIFISILLFSLSSLIAGNVERSENVEAELVSEVSTIQPGIPVTIALRLKMDDGWHTYWRNGADAGLPTEITWTLPAGFTAGEIQWPYPESIATPPLVSYGYHGEVFLLNEIQVPNNLNVGETITLSARADWLECEDVCIPGGVDLEISLLVVKDNPVFNDKWVEVFSNARSMLPVKDTGWTFTSIENTTSIILQAKAPDWFKGDLGKVNFFPFEFGVIEYNQKQEMSFEDGILTLNIKKPSDSDSMPIEGVLVASNGWRGSGSEKAHYINAEKGKLFSEVKKSSGMIDILKYLFFAFLGGIILNLMPCVLPVLSLKILGFVQQASEEKSQAWKHGGMFTFGVLASFWALAGILLILRAGGEQIGWGFQLQEPAFLIILSVFLFIFGLSMFGVFEIGTSLTTIEGKTGTKSGLFGSFLSGITATVVATPCTAPFMGSALGFALTQPAWASMSIFTFLGLGMAFPYVLLASVPALLKFVPKPGRWMESMKQFMGFLLVATVLWLLWVLGLQTGSDMVIVVLGALLLISIASWIYGRWGNIAMSKRSRSIATLIAVLLLVSSVYASINSLDNIAQKPHAGNSSSSEGINWEPFSDELVNDLVDSGKPVFIDFTAAWCLSCQVNEKVTFSSSEVQQAIKDLDIITIKADWTSRDEKITNALAQFGRNSVPLYVYFPGENKEPILLPEIITPGIVLEYFKNSSVTKN